MNKVKKILSIVALCLTLLAMLPAQAMAIDPIDAEHSVTLTVRYAYDGNALKGAAFDVYRVANIDEFAEPTSLSEDFASYRGAVSGMKDSKSWDAVAADLTKYVEKHTNIVPTKSNVVDRDGKCVFTGLDQGLYLVVGHELKVDRYTYACNPFLINLPDRESGSDDWMYGVTAAPKAGEPSYEPPVVPPQKPIDPILPQTGVLWWPVPVLLCVGVITLMVGISKRKNDQ